MPRSTRLLLLLLPALICARSQTVTYNDQIAPIIYDNCSKCHRPGQIGPFPLLSYDDARGKALTIAAVTRTRFMPPWKPEPGWVNYQHERRLTPAQIDLIQNILEFGIDKTFPPLGDRKR